MQRMNLQPLCPHFHDLVANLHDVGESNLVQPLCQANPARFRHGHTVSFRAHLGASPEYLMSFASHRE